MNISEHETMADAVQAMQAEFLDNFGLKLSAAAAREKVIDRIPLEKTIQADILKKLRQIGDSCVAWKANSGTYASMNGVPDITCIYRGKFVGIEVKRPLLGKVSELQQRMADKIDKAGGVYVIATCWRDVEAVLANVDTWMISDFERRER